MHVTEDYYELFSPLTGQNVSWKIRHIKIILRLKAFKKEYPLKKNIEPHKNFTGFYKEGVEAMYEI